MTGVPKALKHSKATSTCKPNEYALWRLYLYHDSLHTRIPSTVHTLKVEKEEEEEEEGEEKYSPLELLKGGEDS